MMDRSKKPGIQEWFNTRCIPGLKSEILPDRGR
jgi:hypothetical protein